MKFKTEQERFWAGEFGSDYIARNQGVLPIAANVALFSRILQRTNSVGSCLEFGANIGLNLRALRILLPEAHFSAIEINPTAGEILKQWFDDDGNGKVYQQSILEWESANHYDLVLIKGVLIHISPEVLQEVYAKLYETSKRYILVAEYYNPTPLGVSYRGHEDKLFKRDFAGEMLDLYPDLTLLDYGFAYHRDPNFPQDDITWFLLEKQR